MTREEHLKAVYVMGTAKRGKRDGLLLLCSGAECGGAEVFVPGLTVGAVLVAANAHVDEMEGAA